MTIKVSKPWSGKKDSLPDPNKKEVHLERKTKKQLQHHIEEMDWKKELKEYKYGNNI